MKYFTGGLFLLLILSACSPKIQMNTQAPATSLDTLSDQDKLRYEFTFAEANRNKMFGELDQAIILFRQCLDMNPGSTASMYELSNIYQYLGEKELAIKYAAQAYTLEKDNIWYGLNLAGLYHQADMKGKTIAVYEEMVREFPEKIDLKYNLAILYQEDGNPRQALKLLGEIEGNLGVSDMVNMAKYNIYDQEKNYVKAGQELEKLIRVFPDEVKYRGILAELYDEMGEAEKAKAVYDELFKLEPDNGLAQLSISSFYERRGNYSESFRWLKAAFENDGVEEDVKIQSIVRLYDKEKIYADYKDNILDLLKILEGQYPDDIKVVTLLADYYLRNNNPGQAVVEIEKLADLDPENYDVWEHWIFLENSRNNMEDVARVSQKALAYFPQKENLYMYKSIAEYQLERYDSVIQTTKKGLQLQIEEKDTQIQLLTLLGEACNARGLYAASDSAFERVLDLDPVNIFVLNNYAYYLSERGERLEDALEMSKTCIVREPENATYLDTYAWILYKLGRIEEAKTYIEKSEQSGGSSDPDIMEHKGDILNALGDPQGAVKAWRTAIENGNVNPELPGKIRQAGGEK